MTTKIVIATQRTACGICHATIEVGEKYEEETSQWLVVGIVIERICIRSALAQSYLKIQSIIEGSERKVRHE